ncbi:MAG: hypothetical protein IPG53_04040 [Ignavibacteriales bacterium]|nr:hypothetical protein [Ignavibacteriales bacterium]
MFTRNIKFLSLLLTIVIMSNLSAIDKNRLFLLKTEEPVIVFKVCFNAGSKDDPKGKEGLAALTAALLNEGGTKKFHLLADS